MNSSPQSRLWHRPLVFLFIIILVSLLSGFLGAFLFDSLLGKNSDLDKNWVGRLGNSGAQELETSLDVLENKQQLHSSLGEVYIKEQNVLGQKALYTGKALGGGAFLTVDGWFVAKLSKEVLSNEKLVIVQNGVVYDVVTFVTDSATALLFLKTEGHSFNPVRFASTLPVVGDRASLFGVEGVLSNLAIASFSTEILENNNNVLNTSFLSSRFVLDRAVSEKYLGAIALNNQGEVFGIVTDRMPDSSGLMPISLFDSKLKEVFVDQNISRLSWEMSHIDLSTTVVAGLENVNQGALITAGVPLALKGVLENGDIVLKVEEQLVGGEHSLAYLLNDFDIGEQIELEIQRNGEILLISVILE